MMSFRQSRNIYAHIDCNSFFASCEVYRNPALRGKCVCVGDQIIIAASYEAKKFGIKTGTPMWEAERILKGKMIKILPDHRFYGQVSKRLMDYMSEMVGKVEVFSVDEFFAEVTGLADISTPEGYVRLAEKLKQDIYKNIGLPVSVGMANTRIKAKIFSDIHKPFGTYAAFSKERIEETFQSLPVRDIPYIGKKNAERLGPLVRTIYDFYNLNPMYIKEILGKNGLTLWFELHGVDVWMPHDTEKKRKSIVCSRSFNHSLSGEYHTLWRHFVENLERAYDTLLREKQEVGVVSVQLKDDVFRSYWRHRDLGTPTIDRNIITKVARELFDEVFEKGKIYRTTGVQFAELQPYIPKQTSIFEIENRAHEENDRLANVIENLKKTFGKQVVHRGFVEKHPRKSPDLEILFEVK